MLIFEQSVKGRSAKSQMPIGKEDIHVPESLKRNTPLRLPEVSELQVIRHYTELSKKNFSIDGQFYPLGSCTMKYNPRGVHAIASLLGFTARHPYAQLTESQGYLQCLFELQEYLKEITGMKGASLTPMAGAQGELAGVLMIKAYHKTRKDWDRTEMIVPDSAHGTNPATAVMGGFSVVEIKTSSEGDLDLEDLQSKLSSRTAGIMLTNPSTLGLFERNIVKVAKMVHAAGGLLYYDGANLNAILGKVRPGDMGFDVMHLNLHKTFATPHGGGGPGAGPVLVNERLLPFLPVPMVKQSDQFYEWVTEKDCPNTIGQLSAFMGNALILIRAYAYIRLLGKEGLRRVSQIAMLNANYLGNELAKIGVEIAFPKRRASHEFIITFKSEAKTEQVTALDFAKRLLDFNMHAPTTYFPLLISECWLVEPTETETKETLDKFVATVKTMLEEAKSDPERLQKAPHCLPVTRLNEVLAARKLDLKWEEEKRSSN